MEKFKNINIEKTLENIYLIFFVIFIAYEFLNTTMFQLSWPENMYENITSVLLILILLRFLAMEQKGLEEFALIFIIGIGFLLPWKSSLYNEIYNCLLVILGAFRIDFRRICRLFLITIGSLLLVTVAAALTGHIENLVYNQADRGIRMAFGVGYPTDFSAYVFYLCTGYCYLRKNKIKLIELTVIAGLGVFVYVFCQARLNTLCILLLTAGFGYYRFRENRAAKKGGEYEMSGPFSMLLALMPSLCAGAVLLGSWFYDADNNLFFRINDLLSNRLYYGKKGLDVYGLTVWGQNIPMQGSGGTTEEQLHYFFLDSSYMFVLLQYGAIVFGCVLFVLCIADFKARKRRDWAFLIAVSVVAVQCIVEHHMMAVQYNLFLCAVLAAWNCENKDKKTSGAARLRMYYESKKAN